VFCFLIVCKDLYYNAIHVFGFFKFIWIYVMMLSLPSSYFFLPDVFRCLFVTSKGECIRPTSGR